MLSDALDQSISLEKRNNRDYILNVTAELITITSEEFNEAMFNGQIINLLEYQDGQQFIKRTMALRGITSIIIKIMIKNTLTR